MTVSAGVFGTKAALVTVLGASLRVCSETGTAATERASTVCFGAADFFATTVAAGTVAGFAETDVDVVASFSSSSSAGLTAGAMVLATAGALLDLGGTAEDFLTCMTMSCFGPSAGGATAERESAEPAVLVPLPTSKFWAAAGDFGVVAAATFAGDCVFTSGFPVFAPSLEAMALLAATASAFACA